jgi:hypothetical protein
MPTHEAKADFADVFSCKFRHSPDNMEVVVKLGVWLGGARK